MRIMTPEDLTGIGDPAVVFTFGRSGTHMVIDLIRRQFAEFASWKYPGEVNRNVFTILDDLAEAGPGTKPLARLRRAARPTFMTHRWPELRERFARDQPVLAKWMTERARIIHVIRDPRKAMRSAWPIVKQRLPASERAVLTPGAFVAESAQRWAGDVAAMAVNPPNLTIRYEDAVADPAHAVRQLADCLECKPLWRNPVMARAHRSRAESRIARLTTTRPNSTSAIEFEHVRRTFRLDWNPELEALLQSYAGEQLRQCNYKEATPRSDVDRSMCKNIVGDPRVYLDSARLALNTPI